ncbi:hypothetical protein BD311DRAFT_760917 [Dichomitus squalens]|uniref:Uncharacterized protein n=1 Tax=Dichomitus squalens TaxID=114155 RepID=A0A4Q9MID2_9APHY|nr:hypothetical protein BD311DRAFT_760917 [Dichomitus squalens]
MDRSLRAWYVAFHVTPMTIASAMIWPPRMTTLPIRLRKEGVVACDTQPSAGTAETDVWWKSP